MKLSTQTLILFLWCFYFQLNAGWFSHVIIIGKDQGIIKILLRQDPQGNWTDFYKNGTNSGFLKANEFAVHFLPRQLGPIIKITSPQFNNLKIAIQEETHWIHLYVLPKFIPGSTLYKEARTDYSKDFAWVPLDDLVDKTQIPISRSRTITIDPSLRIILKAAYSKIIDEAPLNQPTMQQPTLPTTAFNSWNIPGAIKFYDSTAPYYEFTNFYQSPVKIDGKTWPTTEHYYQAMKFNNPTLQEQIRKMSRPRDVFDFARKNKQSERSDWKQVNLQIMLKAVRAKFNQHGDLKNQLLNTGNAILVEDAGSNDAFYGAGADYMGENHLGQLLMKVRDELRGAQVTSYTSQPIAHYTQGLNKPQTALQPVQPNDAALSASLTTLVNSLRTVAAFLL